jgi:predicted DNA-binding protein
MSGAYERITLRLPEELARRIAVLANRSERTLNAELVRAVRSYVEREEEKMDGTMTEDRARYALRPGEKPARRKCPACGSTKTAWEAQDEWVGSNATLRCRVCAEEWVLWPK